MSNPYRPPQVDFSPQPHRLDEADLPLASPMRRLGAYLLDSLLYTIGIAPMLGAVILEDAGVLDTGSEALLIASGAFLVLVCLGLFALTVVWWLQYGQSPGKRLLGIRIVREDGGKAETQELLVLRFGAVFGINVALGLCGLNSIFQMVDNLMIFSDRHQTLHDRIAKTVVVDASYVPPGMAD